MQISPIDGGFSMVLSMQIEHCPEFIARGNRDTRNNMIFMFPLEDFIITVARN